MMRFYPAENEIHIIPLTEFHVGLPRLDIVVDRSILSTKLWDMGGKVTPGLISNKATSLDAGHFRKHGVSTEVEVRHDVISTSPQKWIPSCFGYFG